MIVAQRVAVASCGTRTEASNTCPFGFPSGRQKLKSSPTSQASATVVGNALTDTINGFFNAKVIHRRGPWSNLEAVKFAALERVDCFNNRHLLEPLGNTAPVEAEGQSYAKLDATAMAA